ncbi:hypothetical protein NUSPORA_02412 [Nucleospora cyclopteri]
MLNNLVILLKNIKKVISYQNKKIGHPRCMLKKKFYFDNNKIFTKQLYQQFFVYLLTID